MIEISGGVILKESASIVTYKLKCDTCGTIESPEFNISLTKGVTEISKKKCPNCNNYQVVKVRHANVFSL